MKKIILNSFLVFLIIGCTSTIPIPTLTVNNSTPILPPVSPTTTLEPSQDGCKQVEQVDKSEMESQGTMVFTNLVHNEAYIIKTTTFEKVDINTEDSFVFSIAVSPNRQLTAYELYSQKPELHTLAIIRDDDLPEITIPWEEDWIFISSWVSNEQLLIKLYRPDDEPNRVKELSTFLALNPFTGERKILEPNFPEIYSHHMFPTWGKYGSTVYDSSLELVVYPKDNITSSDTFSHVTLWSLDKQEILADFKIFLTNKTTPRWSPNNEKFVVALVTYEESLKNNNWPIFSLYTVTRFGQIDKITNLSNYFPYYYIGEHTWSPNGKHIAFWLSGWFEQPRDPKDSYLKADQYLAVVEVESKSLKIYCIAGYAFRRNQVEPPIWSPDGTQIIVESPLSNEHSQVILLDLEKEVIAKIGEDMIPVGWMIEP